MRNAKYTDAANTEAPQPIFFVPLAQRVHYDDAPDADRWKMPPTSSEERCLQLHGSMEGLEPQVRQVLSDVDPNLTLLKVQTLQEQVDSEFDQQRAVAQMTGLFGILALILAAVGLYGVTAYTVERRTSEIGVRMALGADRANVIRLVLRGAFLQILIGLAIGIPISIGCSRLIAAQLYHVKAGTRSYWAVPSPRWECARWWPAFIPARRAASDQSGASAADRVTHFHGLSRPFPGGFLRNFFDHESHNLPEQTQAETPTRGRCTLTRTLTGLYKTT